MDSDKLAASPETETVSARRPRPLWPWVVGTICLTAAAVVFSFWWPMYRTNRVLKQIVARDDEIWNGYWANYHHPKWTRFFLDEETFHPWFDELQSVSTCDTRVTGRLLDELQQFHDLKSVMIQVDDTPLEKFGQFKSLKSLALFGSVQPDDLVRHYPFSHYYRREQGSLARFGTGDWERLVTNLHIKDLTLGYFEVHGCPVDNPDINTVAFTLCEIDGTVGEALAGMNGLTTLSLYDSVAQPAFWENLSSHPSLARLELSDTPLSGDAWKAACRIDSLRSLEIEFPWDRTTSLLVPRFDQLKPPMQPEGSCPTDEELEHLKNLTNLEQLALRNVVLPETAIRAIATLPNLQELELDNVSLDASTLAELGNSKSLKSLYLWDTSVTADEVKVFIEQNPHIEVDHDQSMRDSRAKQLISPADPEDAQ